MGEQNISTTVDEEHLRNFMKALLDDVVALEALLETDRFESGVRRVGAEQEMFMVDRSLRPASVVTDVLERLTDPRIHHLSSPASTSRPTSARRCSTAPACAAWRTSSTS